MNRQRVLAFGDDGSAGADVAWLWVCEHRWSGWRAEVISAVMPPVGPPPGREAGEPHPWDPPDPRPGFSEASLAQITYLRADADPRVVLGGCGGADLLVVGARGEGLLKALHLGSTADYLLHHPPAPLLVAKRAMATKTVLVASDGSPHSRVAMDALCAMPWLDTVGSVEAVTVVGADEDVDADGILDEAVSLLAGAGPEPTARRLEQSGSAASTLLDHAQHVGADLLVLGTRGLGPIRRALVGSTATAVTQLAECPVLIAKAEV